MYVWTYLCTYMHAYACVGTYTCMYVCIYVCMCVYVCVILVFAIRELFNAAFVSCWMELTPIQKEDLVVHFKQALLVPNIPEITQTLLNLAEFMEHCEEATVGHYIYMIHDPTMSVGNTAIEQ